MWRCYTYNAILKEHTDRESCEFSVSVCIDSDKPEWPLCMEDTKISLLPGEAVIYNGCKVRHSRSRFDGDYHMQTFLHYVNQDGDYKDHKDDLKRNPNNIFISNTKGS